MTKKAYSHSISILHEILNIPFFAWQKQVFQDLFYSRLPKNIARTEYRNKAKHRDKQRHHEPPTANIASSRLPPQYGDSTGKVSSTRKCHWRPSWLPLASASLDKPHTHSWSRLPKWKSVGVFFERPADHACSRPQRHHCRRRSKQRRCDPFELVRSFLVSSGLTRRPAVVSYGIT